MSPMVIAMVSLRSAVLALSLTGNKKIADGLSLFADAYEAGRATEEHMRLVADKLKTRSVDEADWDDVWERIGVDRAELHRPVDGG